MVRKQKSKMDQKYKPPKEVQVLEESAEYDTSVYAPPGGIGLSQIDP